MSQDTKIRLSPRHLEVLGDTAFFDEKQEATQQIMKLFSRLQEGLQVEWKLSSLSRHIDSPAPKIFKGENYKGYPYVNLDFPRLFLSDRVFAYRTLFWWGQGFSFTLHVQGDLYKELKLELLSTLLKLVGQGYYLCTGETPWQYHYGPDNYTGLDALNQGNNLEEVLGKKTFIKISRRLAISDYEELVNKGLETFRTLTENLVVRSR